MISISIMAGITVLFGTIFSAVDALWPVFTMKPFFIILKKLQVTITEADAFLVISAQIAAIIRLSQNPPLFETAFLRVLPAVLAILICLTALSQVSLNIQKVPRLFTIAIYLALSVHLMLLSTYFASVPPEAFDLYRTVSKECHISRGYVDIREVYIAELSQYTLTTNHYRTAIILAGVMGALIVAAAVWKCYIKPRKARKAKPPMSWKRVRIWKGALAIVNTFLALILLVIVWKLWEVRAILRKVSGSLFQDDEWGFGQVTAALIPTPILITAAHETHGMSWTYIDYLYD